MSFLFPKRSYKRFKRIIDLYNSEYAYKINTSLLCPDLSNDIERKTKAIDNIEKNYDKLTAGLDNWFLSFIKNTAAYNVRKEFANGITEQLIPELCKIQDLVENHFNKEKRLFQKIKYQLQIYFFKSTAFPGWAKIIILSVVTLLTIAIALTGIGALAQLGILGGAAAAFAATKLAILIPASLASSFNLATITTTISTFLAFLSFREWKKSGDIYRFLNLSHDPSPKLSIYYYNFGPSLKEIFYSLPLINEIFTTQGKIHNDAFFHVIRFIINPLRWIISTLNFIQRTIFYILEIGRHDHGRGDTKKLNDFHFYILVALKGIFNILFEIVLTPLQVLQDILDIPFNVVKTIIDTCCSGNSTHQKISENVADPQRQPLLQIESSNNDAEQVIGKYHPVPTSMSKQLLNQNPNEHQKESKKLGATEAATFTV